MKEPLDDEKIGVLMGGDSPEREVSISSGESVLEALDKSGLDARSVVLSGKNLEGEIAAARMTLAFIALHGGSGEDGTVQSVLEELGIPYTGSGPKASRLAMDKIASREIFKSSGMPVPEYRVCRSPEDALRLGLPLVLKPSRQGSSIGVTIVREKADEVREAYKTASRFGGDVIAERYIKGRELTVGILGDEPLPVIEIIPERNYYDYDAKYRDKRTRYSVPAVMPETSAAAARDLASRSHRALGCRGFSRVDMMMDANGKIFVLELNTIPGLTPRSLVPKAAKAAGIQFAELCIMLLRMAVSSACGTARP